MERIMNTSTILEMLHDDPKLLDDRAAFLAKMNTPFDVTVEVRESVVTKTAKSSIAEQNGGLATESDIDHALELLRQKPLLAKVDEISKKIRNAVAAGEIADATLLSLVLSLPRSIRRCNPDRGSRFRVRVIHGCTESNSRLRTRRARAYSAEGIGDMEF